jgi:hypothetical protein
MEQSGQQMAGRAGDSAASLPLEAEHLRELLTEAQRRQRAEAEEAEKGAKGI